METLIFDVTDMRDVAGVRRALAKLDGVAHVDVCQRTDTATVLADTARVTPVQIETAIAKLGYFARVRQSVNH